jgi:hypothetical protein
MSRFSVSTSVVVVSDSKTGIEYLVSSETWEKAKTVSGIIPGNGWQDVARIIRAVDPAVSLKTAWAIAHALMGAE